MSARLRIRSENFLRFKNLSIVNYYCVNFQSALWFISLQWKFTNYFRNDEVSKNVCEKCSVIARQHTSSSRSLSLFTVDMINFEKEKEERALKFRRILKYLTCEFDFIEMNICITFSLSIAPQSMRISNLSLHCYSYSMIIYWFFYLFYVILSDFTYVMNKKWETLFFYMIKVFNELYSKIALLRRLFALKINV